MPADNQHAEVERVIAEAIYEAGPTTWQGRAESALLTLRAALRDGRLTPEQVGSAVGLRAELADDPTCLLTESCECVARLAVATEDA